MKALALAFFILPSNARGSFSGLERDAVPEATLEGGLGSFSVGLSDLNSLHERSRNLATGFGGDKMFRQMDIVLGNSILSMWFESKSVSEAEEYERRLAAYASSCSSNLIDALFLDFKARQLARRDQQHVIDRIMEFYKRIEHISNILRKKEDALGRAQTELAQSEQVYKPLMDRFGRAYIYIKQMVQNVPVKNVVNLYNGELIRLKQEVLGLAVNLRDCPAERIDAASQQLIDFVKHLITVDLIAGSGVTYICEEVLADILDQAVHRSVMNRAKREVKDLSNSVYKLRQELQQLEADTTILSSLLV